MAAVRAVFLDRDGTLNVRPPRGRYVTGPEGLRLLAGAARAVGLFRAAGYATVLVSNQRGVALGHMTRADLRALDARLREHVALDATYYCTHALDAGCPCRKPRAGLLIRAACELDIDLGGSWMIGDSPSDIEAGRRAGCLTMQVAPVDGALLRAARAITGPAAASERWAA